MIAKLHNVANRMAVFEDKASVLFPGIGTHYRTLCLKTLAEKPPEKVGHGYVAAKQRSAEAAYRLRPDRQAVLRGLAESRPNLTEGQRPEQLDI